MSIGPARCALLRRPHHPHLPLHRGNAPVSSGEQGTPVLLAAVPRHAGPGIGGNESPFPAKLARRFRARSASKSQVGWQSEGTCRRWVLSGTGPCLPTPIPGFLRFYRAHGLGNDYVVLEGIEDHSLSTPARIRRLCDRHLGLGSDGLLLPGPGKAAEFSLRIFNPDGSEAEKSGNCLRIIGRYLFDRGRLTGRCTVKTRGGTVAIEVREEAEGAHRFAVDMGRAAVLFTDRDAGTPRKSGPAPSGIDL